ncbi:hypothetical protein N7509_010675 [Penicillium cosmopolitanum]|uniref:Uncharacterized protein n=1 Tax=Penicillium cosmopolitanum TaxID=1131564 RepID=A0A9W9VRW6_9EURO|nr:uncharacterized protein N7509_010675 [Penicillium cosmopolitanum]KAJ5388134.1 hypothetical protein N7509_010675 [Penicillium cosmopolitanum]
MSWRKDLSLIGGSLPGRPQIRALALPMSTVWSQKAQAMSACGPRIGSLVSLLFVLNSTGFAAGYQLLF